MKNRLTTVIEAIVQEEKHLAELDAMPMRAKMHEKRMKGFRAMGYEQAT